MKKKKKELSNIYFLLPSYLLTFKVLTLTWSSDKVSISRRTLRRKSNSRATYFEDFIISIWLDDQYVIKLDFNFVWFSSAYWYRLLMYPISRCEIFPLPLFLFCLHYFVELLSMKYKATRTSASSYLIWVRKTTTEMSFWINNHQIFLW